MTTDSQGNFTCERTYKVGNATYHIPGVPDYGGVPLNLIINVVSWGVMLAIFTLLRRYAWNYGRLAQVTRSKEKSSLVEPTNYNIWSFLFCSPADARRSSFTTSSASHCAETGERSCHWFSSIFTLKDEEIRAKCGNDAVMYLRFQRYLIFYLLFVTLCSLAAVLPVNLQGSLEDSDFGATTVSNLPGASEFLWLHCIMALVYFVVGALFLIHFSLGMSFERDFTKIRTLMISRVPRDKCFTNLIIQYFNEAFPHIEVQDVHFAYNIGKLMDLERKRKAAEKSLSLCGRQLATSGDQPLMVPRVCGNTLSCCCPVTCCGNSCVPQVDAITFYKEEVLQLSARVEEEKVRAFQHALGTMFVTFQTSEMASEVLASFQRGVTCMRKRQIYDSSSSADLKVYRWITRLSPSPENLRWENISITSVKWWFRAIIINLAIFLFLIFCSTPTWLMNIVDNHWFKFNNIQPTNRLSAFFLEVVPTILLVTFSVLLPNLVYYSDLWIGHWSRTSENHTIMRKSFIFLFLMVLVLPSLGLTSVEALLEYTLRDPRNFNIRYQCVFLAGNGAFFVNYVITSAFIGTALEIVRFQELLGYGFRFLFMRSKAEESYVRQKSMWEFQYGISYAWMLCIFSIVLTYSITCPLITPFGLLYIAMKHLTDRYNIYYVYMPARISPGCHGTAVSFAVFACLLVEFNVLFFLILRSENVFSALSIFMLTIVVVSSFLFCGWVFLGWFMNIPCVRYTRLRQHALQGGEQIDSTEANDEVPEKSFPLPSEVFVPDILKSQESYSSSNYQDAVETSVASAESNYGSVHSAS